MAHLKVEVPAQDCELVTRLGREALENAQVSDERRERRHQTHQRYGLQHLHHRREDGALARGRMTAMQQRRGLRARRVRRDESHGCACRGRSRGSVQIGTRKRLFYWLHTKFD